MTATNWYFGLTTEKNIWCNYFLSFISGEKVPGLNFQRVKWNETFFCRPRATSKLKDTCSHGKQNKKYHIHTKMIIFPPWWWHTKKNTPPANSFFNQDCQPRICLYCGTRKWDETVYTHCDWARAIRLHPLYKQISFVLSSQAQTNRWKLFTLKLKKFTLRHRWLTIGLSLRLAAVPFHSIPSSTECFFALPFFLSFVY